MMEEGQVKNGVLAVWMDCVSYGEKDFNEWYNRQHLEERVGVPGFISGARYAAVRADRAYFTWYRTESVSVLASEAYRSRLDNPTEWTQRVMPSFRRTIRSAMVVFQRHGKAVGSYAVTLRMAANQRPPELYSLSQRYHAVACELWDLDREATGEPSAEARIRGPDEQVERAVLMQTTTPEAAEKAAAELEGMGEVGIYGLRAVLFA